LARAWVYARATYASIDSIDPPSKAQRANWNKIVDLLKSNPPTEYELLKQAELAQAEHGWSNPLLSDHAWLECRVDQLRTLVLGP
jgi:hypothetical protein